MWSSILGIALYFAVGAFLAGICSTKDKGEVISIVLLWGLLVPIFPFIAIYGTAFRLGKTVNKRAEQWKRREQHRLEEHQESMRVVEAELDNYLARKNGDEVKTS